MQRFSERQIRTKALRAAAAVALFGGLSCGGLAETDALDPGLVVRPDGGEAVLVADAGPSDAGALDAGHHDVGGADAGLCDAEVANWVECCEAIGWDFDRGCMAWGPPAPPTMTEVA